MKDTKDWHNWKKDYPELENCAEDVRTGIEALIGCFQAGRKLLLCGNGGSAADCEHIAGELLKGFLLKRPLNQEERRALRDAGAEEGFADSLQRGLPVISLVGHPAFATAYWNDVDGKFVFAQQVNVFGKEGDILLAISTSGNAENIYNALICAKAKGMTTIILTGREGGRASKIADIAIKAPADETYRIQEKHLPIYHCICAEIEKQLFGEGNLAL
jgi:D-sedoheptulose 7-phosphate isomerase